MKRALAFTLMVLAIMIIAVSCEEPHVHTYSEDWSSDETNHWHEATCEDTDEKKDVAEHVWDSGKITKFATCTRKGVKTYTCTVCKRTKTEEIPAKGHSFSTSWKSDDTNHWHECSCGEKTDVAAHSWSDWENSSNLSSSSRKCSVCKRTENRNGVVSWDGTAYSWVTNYDTSNSTGFLKTGSGKANDEKIPDSDIDTYKNNATSFITYFKTNLLDTGKITIDTNECKAKPATVTIHSADALASLGLLDKYFAAMSIVESDTTKSTYYKNLFNSKSDVMVYVDTDMDLGGGNWTTVRCVYSIDFQNHTIYNLKCNHPDEDYVGLLGKNLSFNNSISNLVVRNATVVGKKYVGIVITDTGFRTAEISNVEIYDSSVTGFKYVGGVVGYAYIGAISNVTLDNVKVIGDGRTEGSGNDIDTSYQVGGIAGFLLYGDIEHCTVKNSTIKASKEAGGIAGRTKIQDEVPINVRYNTVTETEVTNLEGTSADSFVGYSDKYLGYISGGKYLELTAPADTFDKYFDYKNNNGETIQVKLTIMNNTVDGVRK